MQQMKISTRLSLMIGLLALLLLAVGGVGMYGTSEANAALQTVYEDRTVCLAQLGEIERRMMDNQIQLFAAANDESADASKQRAVTIEANLAAVSKTWKEYTSSYLTPAESALAQRFTLQRQTYAEQGIQRGLAALKADQRDELRRVLSTDVERLFVPAAKTMHELVQLQVDVAKVEYDRAEARYGALRATAIVSIVLGLIAAGALGAATVRSLARQLGGEPHEVVAITSAIAQGDLTSHIDVPAGTPRSVMGSMAEMQAALQRVVSTVRTSSDSIATGSTQIATGNSDLSHRTEEQASNLQQTAASMEQLSAQVRNTAETARQATQLASSASSVAAKGGEVVSQVVSTMGQISHSSRKIADIIAVIDGIAFQTNILALNAAVEAARAGEQGRGFAVVATEVRTLAQRSAQAAREIKTLIGSSVERVETGSQLVADAGVTMKEIVDQVTKVAQLIGEIGQASAEQTGGITQVNAAVGQLDQVTQQNAALVEESAAAAESLRHQAQRLVEVVGVFKLDAGLAASAH